MNLTVNPVSAARLAHDFNADGRSDILFQNSSSGQAAEWQVNGTALLLNSVIGNNIDPAWHAIGTGDFNGRRQGRHLATPDTWFDLGAEQS